MEAKKSRHLVAKAGKILHVFGIEDGKESVEAMGFEGQLKFGEDIMNHLVGKIDGLSRRRGVLRRGRCGCSGEKASGWP